MPRRIVYAANQEHLLRPDGLVVLAREYGALFRGIEVTPINSRYDPIRKKTAQCVYAFATDPEIQQLKLAVLKDTKGAFAGTPFRGFVALRKSASDATPGLRAALDRVSAQLTTSRVRALNTEVTVLHRNARKVAAAFLAAHGIVPAAFAKAVKPVHPELLTDQAADGAPPVGKSARSVRVFFIAGEGRVVSRKRALRAGLSAEGGVKVTIRELLKGPSKGEKRSSTSGRRSRRASRSRRCACAAASRASRCRPTSSRGMTPPRSWRAWRSSCERPTSSRS